MSSSEIDDPNDSDFIPESEDEEESEENCIPPTPVKRKRKIKESQIQESSKDKVTKKKRKYNTLPNDLKQKVANDYVNKISKLQDLVEKDENTDYIAIFTLVMELGSLELDYSFLLSKKLRPRTDTLIDILLKLEHVKCGLPGFRTQTGNLLTKLTEHIDPSVVAGKVKTGSSVLLEDRSFDKAVLGKCNKTYSDTWLNLSEQKKEKVKAFFKTEDPVYPNPKNHKKPYIKCPYEFCGKHITELVRHLTEVKHGNFSLWTNDDARLESSTRKKMFRWLTLDSYKGIYKPSICLIHSKCYKRMALHVKEKHKNVSDIKAFKQKHTEPPVLVVIPKYEEPSFEGFDSADDGEEMLIDEPNHPGHTKTLLFAVRITKRMRITLKSRIKDEFKYTYKNVMDLLKDFQRWCIDIGKSNQQALQTRNRVEFVWKCLDETMCIKNNALKDKEELEDKYFTPLFQKVVENVHTPMDKQERHDKAQTIMSRIFSFVTFLNFLCVRDIYIDLTTREIERIKEKVTELNKRCHKYVIARQLIVTKWKQENLLTSEDFLFIGNSDWAVKIAKLLDAPREHTINKHLACECRNFIIFLICQGNATRSSNIINMTLQHVNEAKTSKEFDSNAPAMIMKSDIYKTSIIYGDKLIVVPSDVFLQIQNYIEFVRPVLISDDKKPDDKRLLFTSSRPKEGTDGRMTTSNVAQGTASVFERSGMSGKNDKCSPTRIRHAIATQLAGYDKEKLEVVASVIMKNRTETTQKHYVQFFCQREAIRLSMKIYERTRGNIDLKSIPKPNAINNEQGMKWLKDRIAEIKKRTGNSVLDKNLFKSFLEEPADEVEYLEGDISSAQAVSTDAQSVSTGNRAVEGDDNSSTSTDSQSVSAGNKDFPGHSTEEELVFSDLLHEEPMSNNLLKKLHKRLSKFTKDDFDKEWPIIKNALVKIAEGKTQSYRHDVYHRKRTHHFSDGKQVLKHHLGYFHFVSLNDELREHIPIVMRKHFPDTQLDYVMDVLEPAAYKFFLVSKCGVSCEEVQYYVENYASNVSVFDEADTVTEDIDDETAGNHVHRPSDAKELIKKKALKDLKELEAVIDGKERKADWHQTKVSRSLTLKLLYISRSMIQNMKFISSQWGSLLDEHRMGFDVKMAAQDAYQIVRYMIKRYKKEDTTGNHRAFNRMLDEARMFYRRSRELQNKIHS